MGYSTFKSSGKAPVTGDQIGDGQIQARHLDPGLFSQLQTIGLHNHSGTKSRRVKTADLDGAFGTGGFYMYDTAGTRYRVVITGGVFVLTAG